MVTKFYGVNGNGFDSGSGLAHFASNHQDKYDVKVKVASDGSGGIGTVKASQDVWDQIESDFLSDPKNYCGMGALG